MKHSWVKRKERKKRLCRWARASISMWPRDDRAQQLSFTGEVAGPRPMPAASLSALIKTMGPGRRWLVSSGGSTLLAQCLHLHLDPLLLCQGGSPSKRQQDRGLIEANGSHGDSSPHPRKNWMEPQAGMGGCHQRLPTSLAQVLVWSSVNLQVPQVVRPLPSPGTTGRASRYRRLTTTHTSRPIELGEATALPVP